MYTRKAAFKRSTARSSIRWSSIGRSSMALVSMIAVFSSVVPTAGLAHSSSHAEHHTAIHTAAHTMTHNASVTLDGAHEAKGKKRKAPKSKKSRKPKRVRNEVTSVSNLPDQFEECYTDRDNTEWCDSYYAMGDTRVSSAGVRAVFTVNNDTLTPVAATAEQNAYAQQIWHRFTTLIAPEQRKLLNKFEVHTPSEMAAYVIKTTKTPEGWTLGIVRGAEEDDLDFVLIHETGHLVTIANNFSDIKNCTTLLDDEDGTCAAPGSFANKFAAQFWSQAMINEAGSKDNRLFRKSKSSFVDDYAATNPFEDMAETFAYFVLDFPVKGDVARQKIAMFTNDPQMSAIKASIVARRAASSTPVAA